MVVAGRLVAPLIVAVTPAGHTVPEEVPHSRAAADLGMAPPGRLAHAVPSRTGSGIHSREAHAAALGRPDRVVFQAVLHRLVSATHVRRAPMGSGIRSAVATNSRVELPHPLLAAPG
jgi:hypothetical protein